MFLKHLKWPILWALIIFLLCTLPGKEIPHISFLEILNFDKFVHAGIFFVLILLTIRGFLVQTKFFVVQHSAKFIALLICVIYGGLLEIMQAKFCEGRTADILDFIANSFGSIVGLLMYNWIEKKFLQKKTT